MSGGVGDRLHSYPKVWNREELAWAAGLFEGEGAVCWNAAGLGRRRAQACMSSTDEDVIRHFAAVVKVGRVHGPYTKDGRKPVWKWVAAHFPATQAVVAMLWPWLGERRRATAVRVLRGARSTPSKPETARNNGRMSRGPFALVP